MQALIMLPGLRESLTSFEIKNYFQTTRNPLDVDDQEERTTCPLREFGPNWKKLRLGGYAGLVPTEPIDILSEVVKMPQLEELSISVTKTSHRYLKDHVLHVMPNLKNLFLISSDMEGDTNCRECQANDLDRLSCCAKDIFMINRLSMMRRKDFQPLQLVGCYNRFYTCVRRDAEPGNFHFGVNYRDANGRKAIAYYQVLDVTNVEQYDFTQDLRAVRFCDSATVKSQYSICSGFSLYERSVNLDFLPGPERDLPNDPPTVTSNVKLVS